MQDLVYNTKEKMTIDIVLANVFGVVMIVPIALLYGLPFYFIWQPQLHIDQFINPYTEPLTLAIGVLLFLGIMLLGIIVHELIHGIIWAHFTNGGLKSIKLGISWKMLTPYCHCTEALQVRHYIIGAMMPAIILGVLPSILAVLIGNFGLLLFGIFFTASSAGDFLIINLLRKLKSTDLVQDHPSEAGCFVYRKIS